MTSNLNFYLKNGVFVIAELSANHNGNKEIAIETIKAAKRAGANAIKLQTYTADSMTLDSNSPDFLINHNTVWDGKKLFDLYKEASTPYEWHFDLFEVAKKEGLVCFSTPFDKNSVDFLETLNNPIYKIASCEITDIPLIEYVASKNKPIIISTGVSSLEDIVLAIETCKKMGNNDIAILKCTSGYPAPISEANLRMIEEFSDRFGIVSGLSDHTLGIISPIVAVAKGAKIIEKHFILDKTIGGPDADFSLDESEFTQMVKAVREAEIVLGEVDYNLTNKQLIGREFSRSLYINEDVKKGDVVTNLNVRSVRPGYGLHPKYLSDILGKKFKNDQKKGTRVSLDLFNFKCG